ncbi:MAG: Filamentation induced by cAMP protein Fic [Gammaproteobacteria bacterium]|jgi:predicted ArsR family transcriptional regulator|nr:Filamentation induced by cAMP protein Fic [Gammaproteobacteria bacterium]
MLQALYTAMKSVILDEMNGSPKSSSKTEDKLLGLIRKNPNISSTIPSQILGISKRAVLKQISKLKAEGKLKRIGPAKGGHWQITKKTKDEMKARKYELDAEEKEIEAAFELGEYKPVANMEEEIARFRRAAKAHRNKKTVKWEIGI